MSQESLRKLLSHQAIFKYPSQADQSVAQPLIFFLLFCFLVDFFLPHSFSPGHQLLVLQVRNPLLHWMLRLGRPLFCRQRAVSCMGTRCNHALTQSESPPQPSLPSASLLWKVKWKMVCQHFIYVTLNLNTSTRKRGKSPTSWLRSI